jgi:hypothetical protein
VRTQSSLRGRDSRNGVGSKAIEVDVGQRILVDHGQDVGHPVGGGVVGEETLLDGAYRLLDLACEGAAVLRAERNLPLPAGSEVHHRLHRQSR